MRLPRSKGCDPLPIVYFHLVDRVCDRAFKLDDPDGRDAFVSVMKAYSILCDVEIVT